MESPLAIVPKTTNSLTEPLTSTPLHMQRAILYYFLLPLFVFIYNFSLCLLQKTFGHTLNVNSASDSVVWHRISDDFSLQHPKPILLFYRVNSFETLNVPFRNRGGSKGEGYLIALIISLVSRMGSCISVLLQSGCTSACSRVVLCSWILCYGLVSAVEYTRGLQNWFRVATF